jgi:hypothetical protein
VGELSDEMNAIERRDSEQCERASYGKLPSLLSLHSALHSIDVYLSLRGLLLQ